MTFTPKFVDLVRNFATVQGSGEVTLGSAVYGYTGLTAALQPGDQFYYNLQGVDKPHEREIGRGTLEANGKVAREAISGSLTPFSSGTKTIALVAAAEWFSKLESGGAGGGQSAFVSPQDFGAVADGVTDDTQAFKDALDFLDQDAAGINGRPRLYIPAGTYYLTDTLHVRATLIIEGDGMLATKLKWAAGKTGIIIQRVNTDDDLTSSVPAWTVGGGDYSTIRMMTLEGGYTSTEGEYHGIALRARAYLSDLWVQNWQGDGIFSDATAGGATEGNANCATVTRCIVTTCRKGMYVNGADTNVWTVIGCDFRGNRTWGVDDSSFLGNTYVGCHAAANGWDGAQTSIPTACTLSSKRYYVKVGQAAGASTNAPTGTTADNSWWGYIGPGNTYNGVVVWESGTVFREGGAYKTDNSNARNCFLGCYSESDCNPSQMVSPSLVVGGLHGAGLAGIVQLDASGTFAVVNSGPKSGAAANGNLYINSNVLNQSGTLNFQTWNAGSPVLCATIQATSSAGGGWLYYDAKAGKHIFRLNGVQVAELASGGLNLATGNGVRVNGTQVVGERGAAVADATDAATAITQLNALLARLRVHGLIAA